MKAIDMKVTRVPISKLRFAPYNPRIMDGDTFNKLKENIMFFKCYEPLMVNLRTWHVIGGNQKLRAFIELGFTEVDVVLVDFSLEVEKQLNISLNKIVGRFDEPKLTEIFIELQKLPDFKIELTGFEPAEVSQLLDRYKETEENNFDFDICVDSIKEPIAKEGDLIELGPHRILCGDSGNPDHLKRLLGKEKVNLLNCDPPYNVNYYGGNRPQANARSKKHKLWDKIYSDNFSQQDYEKWLKNIFSQIMPYFAEGAPFYIWNGHRQFGPMHLMLTELGFHVACIITWAKERFAIGFGDYNQQTEFCLYGWRENNGKHVWCGPNNESTLWEVHRDLARDYIHPTQKPIELAQRAIRNSSKRNDLVVDLFLGSGSTLIAAESLGRRCFGLEQDRKYFQAIIRRYILHVGQDKVSSEIVKRYLGEDKNEY